MGFGCMILGARLRGLVTNSRCAESKTFQFMPHTEFFGSEVEACSHKNRSSVLVTKDFSHEYSHNETCIPH